ncbi:acyl-CoA desaturase [Jannaschia sp. CCS1]|uniref:acyl-CoA desaturase n=1 Tax=Jannaschia sp. (strain CCS1) TaxID=290400 RepID=UPI000053BFFD|nr:acyl-CoA desaturase [Jannaschia sp. CCS1]ABD53628.1 Delta-9 acyl-phospholipid desaturase [Jannaschia sp. CCS1]
MAQELTATDRVTPRQDCSATQGRVVWAPAKSLWFSAMALGGVVGVVVFPSWGAAGVTLVLMLLTLCLGHSVGMHRLLIHRSFRTPRWLEYVLMYLGTLVGMAGPIGMFQIHEIRDWQQQQPDCHSFAKHDVGFWRDAMWQMHCEQRLDHPPALHIEDRVAQDPFYRWLEATWRWQQLPLAALLFAMGGVGFVLWGIGLRVAVSLAGHWVTVHFAHTRGERPFVQDDIAVDGRNLPALGFVTFGEAFHNNHHAFPRSARMGHHAGQIDPGWWVIRTLGAVGLAWDIRTPHSNDTLDLEGAYS